jgi:hypothetical protein
MNKMDTRKIYRVRWSVMFDERHSRNNEHSMNVIMSMFRRHVRHLSIGNTWEHQSRALIYWQVRTCRCWRLVQQWIIVIEWTDFRVINHNLVSMFSYAYDWRFLSCLFRFLSGIRLSTRLHVDVISLAYVKWCLQTVETRNAWPRRANQRLVTERHLSSLLVDCICTIDRRDLNEKRHDRLLATYLPTKCHTFWWNIHGC